MQKYDFQEKKKQNWIVPLFIQINKEIYVKRLSLPISVPDLQVSAQWPFVETSDAENNVIILEIKRMEYRNFLILRQFSERWSMIEGPLQSN